MRSFWSGLCLVLALLLGAVPAARAELTVCSAGCDVPNMIDSDRTWKAATYRVQEHIQVRPGVTLTLEPGVTLLFTTHEMGLQVGGTLIARGTAEKPITFTSDKATPAPKDWGTLLFTETAVGASFDGEGNYVGGSIFEHCVVEYAGGGAAQGAIWAQSPRVPFVYRSTIRNNGVSGLRFVGPPKAGGGNEGIQEARVRDSEISANSAAGYGNGYGGGIYVSVNSGTATLSGNTLSENIAGSAGGGIYVSVTSSGTATLSGNTLSANSAYGGGGIYVSVNSGTATLSGNTLSANSAGYGGGGIYISVDSSMTAILRENQVLDNTASRSEGGGAGGGIHIERGQPTFGRNDLIGNAPRQLWDGNTAPNPASPPHLDVRHHWWGTADEAEIGRGIWDWTDDLGLEVVDWRPSLTVPVFPFSSNLPPAAPASPSPASGVSSIARNPTLSWSAGTDPDPGDTVSYDVYLGTSTDPPRVSQGQSVPSYTLPALLERNTRYYWRVVAHDSWGEETASPRWSFTTGSSPGPTLDPIGNKTVGEGQTLSFTLSGSDPDRKPLTFSASNLPPGAAFDPATRTFSWTPTFTQEGTYPGVRFQVSNGTYTASQAITLTVTHANAPPSLDPVGNRQVNEGEVLSFTISAGDPDGTEGLAFSASNLPSGASFDPAARRFSWTPSYDQAGAYTGVRFQVSDGTYTDSEEIEIRVVNVNRPPILGPVGNQEVNEGQTLSFTLTGADPDGDFLLFTASNLPVGASFDPAARRFSWTPTYDQAGTYTGVRFQVSDGSFNDSEEIAIIVADVRLPQEGAYEHLTQVMDRYQTGDTPRLLESYTATPTFDSQKNVAHLYDSALALWAFLERGSAEDISRARVIAEAFVTLQQRDPIGDGRLRDAYPADFLIDGAGVARLQLASSHTGNLAWAILALMHYDQAQGGEGYREAAIKIGEWIATHTFDIRGAGGFTGGVDDALQPIRWKSTEHNLDLYAAFMRLYEATGERRWLGWAAHARSFLEAMWDEGEGRFWTGTLSDGVTLNREPIPLDVQAWAVLALGKGYAGGLAWAQGALRQDPCECGSFFPLQGYRFSTGGGGCWFEGTAHLSLARRVAGEGADAGALLGELREAQASAPNGDGGGIVAACSDGVETGYGWSYFNALHVGATAWYLLAEQGVNPLEDPEVSIGPSVSGTVWDSKKLPVPGVRVEARGADGMLVGVGITDAQGHYRLELPAGKYILTPLKETHLFSPASRKVTVKLKDRGKMNFTVKLLTLSGAVKDKNGKPLAGVTLSLLQGEVTVGTAVTNAKGKYSFSLYNPGTYTVVPSRPGSRFAPEIAEVSLTKGNRGRIKFKEVP